MTTGNYSDDEHSSIDGYQYHSSAKSEGHTARQALSLQNLISDEASTSSLPSKVYVKFYVHEEATSSQTTISNDLSQITSAVTVSGKVYAQVQSINVLKTVSPITIDIANSQHPEKLDWCLSSKVESDGVNTIYIPKTAIEKIEVATFTNSFSKQSMPITIQSEINRKAEECSAIFQFRSNPANSSPLRDMVVSIAVHPSIISETLKFDGDNGSYNELKKLVTWRIKELPRRNNLQFGISGKLIPSYAIDPSKMPTFPVVLRCDSRTDGVSGVEVRTKPNEFAKTTAKTFNSFRLVHRA